MAKGTIGETIDLHGGGSDLIFPHHECERAQSEAANGTTFVTHWMHCAMVAYEGTKMSKSLGNLVFVSELSKTADPRAIRLALMRHHCCERAGPCAVCTTFASGSRQRPRCPCRPRRPQRPGRWHTPRRI